jgi:uncharacterized damage-inducible protein DinB
MTDDLQSLFHYLRWADNRLIDACRKLDGEQYRSEPAPGWPSLRATVVHIADGGAIWLSRVTVGENPAVRLSEMDVPSVEDVARILSSVHDGFDQFVAALPAEKLAGPFTYRNLRGEEATLPLWVVLRHVVNHATYHRGQAASKLRLLGAEPPVTDLSQWAIESLGATK